MFDNRYVVLIRSARKLVENEIDSVTIHFATLHNYCKSNIKFCQPLELSAAVVFAGVMHY